ncbi:MAG: lactonase family protein [Gemmatimonadaceae bacterium]
MRQFTSAAFAAAFVAMAACDNQTTTPSSSAKAGGAQNGTPGFAVAAATANADRDQSGEGSGAVFVTTNAVSGNTVVAFSRNAHGSLVLRGAYSTGGTGTGGTVDPLASEFAVILSNDNHNLYVVNAGSGSISSFAVANDGALQLLGTAGSRGAMPVSLATSAHRLFVLNAGDNSVAGFSVGDNGALHPITGSRITLGGAADGPSTINVSHDGRYLFVTQRVANAIDVIAVGDGGTLRFVTRQHSSGSTPFGFAVTNRDQLVVSEAAGDAPNGAVSSYSLSHDGSLRLVSGSVSTHQGATCWLILSTNGQYAFAANAGSGSITGYAVGEDGSLRILTANGRTGITSDPTAAPLDMGTSRNGRFLYVLEGHAGAIGAFAVGADGHLSALADTPGLAPSSGLQGLAAF